MKKAFFIPFLLVALAFAFAACEETTEPGAYDNWRERNDAFIDSIRTETGENYLVWRNPATRVTTDLGQTPMELGKLYAIEVQDGGTSAGLEYTYAKKLVDNPDGTRLLATDYVEIFYRGTYINGVEFDGNFDGYGALDQDIPLDPAQMKWPTDFDEPATFTVNSASVVSSGVVSGLSWVLQHARTGERWIAYIPYSVGYGESDYSSMYSSSIIPGCSVLTFDFIIGDIVED